MVPADPKARTGQGATGHPRVRGAQLPHRRGLGDRDVVEDTETGEQVKSVLLEPQLITRDNVADDVRIVLAAAEAERRIMTRPFTTEVLTRRMERANDQAAEAGLTCRVMATSAVIGRPVLSAKAISSFSGRWMVQTE
jgi:hypothetical protein